MSNQWNDLLNNTKLGDICTKDVIRLEASRSLKECLQILKDRKLLSLPIHEGDNKNKIIGFVDVLDITAYALALWRKNTKSFFQRTEAKFSQLNLSKQFFDSPVRELINYSGRDELIQLDENGSLADCIKMLNSRRDRVHRIGITRNNGQEFVGLITQSDIIKFLHKNLNLFNLADKTLKELNLVRTCIMVRYDRPLIETLDLLVNNKISGIALVDWEFNVIANFSASDLKGMLPDAFDLFWKPTLDFLRQGTETKSSIPPVTCLPKTPLRDVVKNVLSPEKGIHRVFVTKNKDNNRIKGICTLTDIVSLVAEGLTGIQT